MNKDQANQSATLEDAKREIRPVVNELREEVHHAGEQLKQKAREATEQIKEQGYEMAAQQKDTMVDSLDHFGSALRHAAQHLHEKQEQGFAGVTERVADQIEATTHYLRNQDFQSLYHDAQTYARRHPELVFGAMFFAGLAIGRFLKATPQSDWEHQRASYVNSAQAPMPAASNEAPLPIRNEAGPVPIEVAPAPAI